MDFLGNIFLGIRIFDWIVLVFLFSISARTFGVRDRLTYLEDKGTIEFPNPLDTGSADGLIAVGGNLERSTLLNAYRRGLFPWTREGEPLMWWVQDPRLVLFLDELKLLMQDLFK